ncbi:MAG TPA: hypothetical protein DDW94_10605 [Deltaproteobacteria bacterium]|nr:MAG: hypothetical protein A2Z79_11770 [Deltaproteobacteria bacterium GWA2_55_82]OIJ74926.1 MAG: hypothetical protein A2V21_312015 [Deltaproteobacteria bacterium GWC2_55_46]HBG47419.1 hypothetical protein [Deltaproteobacteria bacterium]HCY11435.1 hypothetical protein [Deltaproteobacteria bacterium]
MSVAVKKVNVAIVGTGGFAGEHARALTGDARSAVAGVYGSDPERRNEFARRYGVKSYSSFEECLNDNEVSFVDIVCRHNEHARYGIMAAEAGKNVIVEKPIDIELEAARRLVDVCAKKGVRLYVISQFRYSQALRKIKKEIEAGSFGRVYAMNLSMNWHRPQAYYDSSGGWRKRPDLAGGGVLMMQCIHWIDVLLWLGGEAEGLGCEMRTVSHQIGVEDTASGQILFKGGAVASFQASTSASSRQPDRLEVYGTKGAAAVQNNRIVQWSFGADAKGSRARWLAVSLIYSMMPWRKGLLGDQLLDIISNRAEPNGKEALKALEVIIDLYRCAKRIQCSDADSQVLKCF